MREEIVTRLLHLNQQFYQTFAKQFAETRSRLQPGVQRVLEGLPPDVSVLDLGCGIGEVACELARRDHQGSYLGMDASDTLLAIARERCEHPRAAFFQADLGDPDWFEGFSILDHAQTSKSFDRILAFALLHHLPGRNLRMRVLQQIICLLAESGQFVHSNWNFMVSPRLRKRIVSWSSIGINQEDIEPRDYLLDWRRGGYGLRYVHHFTEQELLDLADTAGFRVVETFYSDGEGGRLGLYQVWEKVRNAGNTSSHPEGSGVQL